MITPFFTIIVPLTKRLSYLFPFTLDSLIAQRGTSSFEVIIVDATEGKALLHHLSLDQVTVIPAQSDNLFAMLNLALKRARGQYTHILSPGEFYMSKKALAFVAKIIHAYDFPDLLYSARMMRHSFGQPTIDIYPIKENDLKGARIPTTLQPFWFRSQTLEMIGGFNEKYQIQGGFELICRYFQSPTLKKAFVKRVITDYEYRKPTPRWIIRQCLETFWISLAKFGPTLHLFAWLIQNCLRLFRFSWKIARIAFWKRHVAY
jgi:hypothetical protein